jgi:hypothetical protein
MMIGLLELEAYRQAKVAGYDTQKARWATFSAYWGQWRDVMDIDVTPRGHAW